MKKPKIIKPTLLKGITLYEGKKDIGYIQLVSIGRELIRPQIEYKLKKPYRNKGIMTKELPLFLDKIKDEYPQIIAIVKEDNIASSRVLDKVGFCRLSKIGDKDIYIRDFRIGVEKTKETIAKFNSLGLVDK